jgi:folate-dependent phosphoribosylglycinamide formyltransferase PurN
VTAAVEFVRARLAADSARWRAEESTLTDSAVFQDRASGRRRLIVAEEIEAYAPALVARESGEFDTAVALLRGLLDRPGLGERLRAEAHCALGDLLDLTTGDIDAAVAEMVACLTFAEHHERALSVVRRARADAARRAQSSLPPGPRIVLVLGSNYATVAFANRMLRRLPIAGLLQQYAEYPLVDPALRRAPTARPLGLSADEVSLFADEAVLGNEWNAIFVEPWVPTRYVSRGEANDDASLRWLASLQPDIILSHGPERLSAAFIASARHGGINVHWGLSPAYRGMHTSRWALVDGAPEWVGVTVHTLDPGLDSGSILYQARPRIELTDTIRQVEYRLTNLASEIVPQAVDEVLSGRAHPIPQPPGIGREYRLRDWRPEYDARLTPEYIAEMAATYERDRDRRDAAAPLINPWDAGRPGTDES